MVYLIDASVYVFRAWYAWPDGLADADGNPTHALYGFARFLGELLERRMPSHVAVAFDESHGRGLRCRLYPPYKAHREPAPAPLKRQFALCRQFCRHLGVAEFASEEYEADDLIGTLAARCRAEGRAVTVVSCDKDLAQLIGPLDVFWDYAGAREYRYPQIAGRFGALPERMADYLALRGDSVDNVPGVPGIGAKTAALLLTAFASLEEIFASLERTAELPVRGAGALPARLRAHRNSAFLARALTRIDCEVPLSAGSAELSRRTPDLAGIAAFCASHGFGTLLARQAERLAGQHARAA
ncbi:MAG TPA: 5'-3' exonuclease H3TH domain-containing protein [Steroidobacteraceae bacterium]|nr:5'-3' exonuclease H3TH domain-containing protein [Steroidobacteraceae bacterium]